MNKVVCILSGGLDSTTLLYLLIKKYQYDVEALSFYYGQKHYKEIEMAKQTTKKLNIKHNILDISCILSAINNNALTNKDINIPSGCYVDESMKQTVVPNRNSILINIALAYAINIKSNLVAYGAHSGDHAIYPDCRSEFVKEVNRLAKVIHYEPLSVIAPFLFYSKADIIKEGIELKVDYSLTWTCYKGEERPCLKCGSCNERIEAFYQNNIKDPLLNSYEWAQALLINKKLDTCCSNI